MHLTISKVALAIFLQTSLSATSEPTFADLHSGNPQTKSCLKWHQMRFGRTGHPVQKPDGNQAVSKSGVCFVGTLLFDRWHSSGSIRPPSRLSSPTTSTQAANTPVLRRSCARTWRSAAQQNEQPNGAGLPIRRVEGTQSVRRNESRQDTNQSLFRNPESPWRQHGYVSLVVLKDAIDTIADWKTPDLTGTQYVTRKKQRAAAAAASAAGKSWLDPPSPGAKPPPAGGRLGSIMPQASAAAGGSPRLRQPAAAAHPPTAPADALEPAAAAAADHEPLFDQPLFDKPLFDKPLLDKSLFDGEYLAGAYVDSLNRSLAGALSSGSLSAPAPAVEAAPPPHAPYPPAAAAAQPASAAGGEGPGERGPPPG